MADVFISYASEDRERVRPLAAALETLGLSVWWDRALAAGDDYAAVIARELAGAKSVVVVWSEASALSAFVRDEAGRARDAGRLVPVLLDRVEIPLGFGALQAEDFTAWNGAANAPQVQLLVESLRARIEGRAVDGAAVQAKRKRLMARVRIVSVLMGLAAVVAIAVGVQALMRRGAPAPAPVVQADPTAELLRALNEGRITGDQAIRLAELLRAQAFSDAEPDAGADAATKGPSAAAAKPTFVAWPQFLAAAETTYQAAMVDLAQSPRPEVRQALYDLADPNPAKQTQGRAALRALAEAAGPGGESEAMWRAIGARGLAVALSSQERDAALAALARVRAVSPTDQRIWTMISYGLAQSEHTRSLAQASALVGEGLAAKSAADLPAAYAALERALPLMTEPGARAFVEGQLGDVANQQGAYQDAVAHYAAAVNALFAAGPDGAPDPAALRVDAERLGRAIERGGATPVACRPLHRAAAAGVTPHEPAQRLCAERGLWRVARARPAPPVMVGDGLNPPSPPPPISPPG